MDCIERVHTWDTTSYLYVTIAMLVRTEDRLRLHEVGAIAIVVHAARVESGPSSLPAQSRDQEDCSNNRSAVRWWCGQRNRGYPNISLYSQNLQHRKLMNNQIPSRCEITDDELAAVKIRALGRIESFPEIEQAPDDILVPHKPIVVCRGIPRLVPRKPSLQARRDIPLRLHGVVKRAS